MKSIIMHPTIRSLTLYTFPVQSLCSSYTWILETFTGEFFFLRNCSCSLQHTIVKRKIVLSIQPVINLIVSIFYSTVFPPFGRLFTAISYFTRCVILLAIFHSLYFPLFWSILIALRCLIPFSFIPTAIDFLYLISIRVPSHVHKRKCRSVFLTL